MAKISFLIIVVALIAFLHAYEAHRVGNFRESLGKDLHKAKAKIEEDLKAKKMDIKGLKSEVKTLSKSEKELKQLEKANKKDMDSALNAKKLKKFSRTINMKKVAAKKKKPVSIIQSILHDFGFNGGKN